MTDLAEIKEKIKNFETKQKELAQLRREVEDLLTDKFVKSLMEKAILESGLIPIFGIETAYIEYRDYAEDEDLSISFTCKTSDLFGSVTGSIHLSHHGYKPTLSFSGKFVTPVSQKNSELLALAESIMEIVRILPDVMNIEGWIINKEEEENTSGFDISWKSRSREYRGFGV